MSVPAKHQAVIPSYEFQCCGNITVWGVDIDYHGNADITLDLQIWRPSPTIPDDSTLKTGHYSLVGNNRFSTISQSAGIVMVTPSPHEQIMFRPGDVVGFWIEEPKDKDNDKGLVVVTTSTFTSEVVWHASVAPSDDSGCTKSLGSSGHLNTLVRGAPVISFDTS